MNVGQFRERVDAYRALLTRMYPALDGFGHGQLQPGEPRIYIDDGDLFAEVDDCDYVPLDVRLDLAHSCGLLLLAGSELDTLYVLNAAHLPI
jgi:hypothetical protein